MATYLVTTGAEFQTALDICVAGDIINLDYTKTFVGNFILRNRGVIPVGQEIIIQGNAPLVNLPAVGFRITPSYSPFLPKIQQGNADPPFRSALSANGYIIRFIEFLGTTTGFGGIIVLGSNDVDQTLKSQQTYNVLLDRCYIHSNHLRRQKTGISLNGKNLNVTNCYTDYMGGIGQDTYSIVISNGEGPHLIENNYLYAGAYAVMVGGNDVPARTVATVLASPAPTTNSATVSTLTDLVVGQLIAVLYVDAQGTQRRKHPHVTNINTSTNRITYEDIGVLPLIPGDIRWGVLPTGMIFRRNHFTRRPTDRNALLPNAPVLNTPTTSASASGLAAGTWYARIHGYGDNIGYTNLDLWTPAGTERTIVLGAQSTIGLSWPAVPNVTHYRAWVYQKDVNGAITNGRWHETTNLSLTIGNTGGTTFTSISNVNGTGIVIKNFFELKTGVDVLVEANIFENSWMGGDNGGAIWLKSNNQSGNHEFAEVSNVTFRNNVLRHLEGFCSISGQRIGANLTVADYPAPLHSIYFYNNLVYDSQGVKTDSAGNVVATSRFCDVAQGVYDVIFDHNTIIHRTHGNFLLALPNNNTDPLRDFYLTNNLWFHNSFGIFGAGGFGKISLDAAIPSLTYDYNFNAMGGANASNYTWPGKTNFSPATATLEAQFKNYGGPNIQDYKLKRLSEGDNIDSLYINAGSDGEDLGVDIEVLLAAINGVIEGVPSGEEEPPPPPPPPALGNAIRRRDFTKNVANYMSLGIGGLGALLSGRNRFTMLVKASVDSITAGSDNNFISVVQTTNQGGAVLGIDGPTGRVKLSARSAIGETSKTLVGNTTISLGSVAYVGGVFDIAGDILRAYLNGVADGVSTTPAFTSGTWTFGSPTIPDAIGSFNAPPINTNSQIDGQIYYVAVWSDELTATEFDSLADGASPEDVSPESLIYYLPMSGQTSPEVPVVGGPQGTITGSIPALIDQPFTGVQAAGEIESISVEGNLIRAITGVQATGQVGSVSPPPTSTQALTGTGVLGTGQVGTLTPVIVLPAPLVATHGVLEMELNGRGNGWTVNNDWRVRPGINWGRGLPGNRISDCLAEPGFMSFVLDNSERNSAGLMGYYSPGHANCRAGFQDGIGVRYRIPSNVDDTGEIRFTGMLDVIDAIPGTRGPRLVYCEVVDWLGRAQTIPMPSLPVTTDVTGDVAFAMLIEALASDVRPRSVETDPSPDIFPYVFDRARDERTMVYDELYRIATSGLNYVWVRGDGTLVYESRARRAGGAVSVDSFTDHHGFSARRDRSMLVNKVQATVHPRNTNDVEAVLYNLNEPLQIAAGSSVNILAPWTDEANPDIRVGAVSLTPLEGGFDYQANTDPGGNGTDLTGYLVVQSIVSGNATDFTIALNGPFNGYITRLRQRGFPLYDYGATVLQWSDTLSIVKRGMASDEIDLQYQASLSFGQEVAQFIVYSRANPTTTISGFTRRVSVPNTVELERSVRREISDRVDILDELTAINQPFFINRIEEREVEGVIDTQWILIPADVSSYWQLDVDGKSELDSTTKLGFGLIVGHSDAPHQDVHNDVTHQDVAHTDVAHTDFAHGDSTVTHSDVAHSDSHGDTTHFDSPHVDSPHTDNHQDIPHTDQHEDVPHQDWLIPTFTDAFNPQQFEHYDAPHGDSSISSPHEDVHNDFPHIDDRHQDAGGENTHSDVNHSDQAAGHVDSGHGDVSHGDTLHSDVLHTDVHQDTVHIDQNW